jgi:transglutaminase-like putative cysteine protease
MQYKINHTTTYTYDRPVCLSSHLLRLRPRCDVTQALRSSRLDIDPAPIKISENVDLDGNVVIKVWFADAAVKTLIVKATSEVETYRTNPFDFLLEDWAVQLPIDYASSLLSQLQPYLSGQFFPSAIDPIALQLAQEISQAVAGDTVNFLTELNQRIYQTCRYLVRETGEPLAPGTTWTERSGSCRDFAVLFIETCRAIGLAARFVSGYQEGDPDQSERHLHAWAEVYLPGAGWRGYDPTHGLAVSDRHIALVASPSARQTTPILGSLKSTTVQSEMTYSLSIQSL